MRWGAIVLVVLFGLTVAPQASARNRPEIAFARTEGHNGNLFVRDRAIAAHLVYRGGTRPRLIVAFPAGNSGTLLQFGPTPRPISWHLVGPPTPVVEHDAHGRPMRGITVTFDVATPVLRPGHAVLSSVRVIRDVLSGHAEPDVVRADPRIAGQTWQWARDRADGAAGYAMRVAVLAGHVDTGAILAPVQGRIRIRLTALTGELPLTALDATQLLNARANRDPAARRTLAFLSYREKFLAGSWRFNTYFGRDTLYTLRLLQDALRPKATEAGFATVLARLSPDGEAAHEEGIGEFAVLARHGAGDAPTFDYGMVDTSLLLLPVLADYLETPAGRRRGAAFLASPITALNPGTPSGRAGDLLARNVRWLWHITDSFARAPQATNLIALKPGHPAGQWRDSDDGLGRGRYPYDVNAVLAPAALAATARLCATGLLEPYLAWNETSQICGGAETRAQMWQRDAPALFIVDQDQAEARQQVTAYAATLRINATKALAALGRSAVSFHAIALDAEGRPVPVMHSDESLALLFGFPPLARLGYSLTAMMRPFPAGLASDAGLIVANPAFADRTLQSRFGAGAYHGTVVWSWQQALLVAGLDRQLGRNDLPVPLRSQLIAARRWIWHAIHVTHTFANSELWSWRTDGKPGRIRPVAYGAKSGDADEANAAQLWSTVFLGLHDPIHQAHRGEDGAPKIAPPADPFRSHAGIADRRR